MPLYEYECQQCRKHTEKIQKFSDPEITTCPHCGGPLQRVITAPAVHFAGGGWYADGYGSKKPADKSSSSDSTVPAVSASSDSSTPASTPAATPVSAPSTPAPSSDKK